MSVAYNWRILRDKLDDYVIGAEKEHSVEDFAQKVFCRAHNVCR